MEVLDYLIFFPGQLHTDLRNFLEANLPRRKKSKTTLGVSDPKLAGNISEQIEGVKCVCSGVVTELMRGVRIHLEHIAKDLAHHSFSKAQLSLGHSYSRGKVGLFALYACSHRSFETDFKISKV